MHREYFMMNDFLKEVDIAISVCDRDGIIRYMNDKGEKIFINEGGRNLIGSHILDCHPEPSRTKLEQMIASRTTNSYFKGSGSERRLIHQAPFFNQGVYDGFIECIIPMPEKESSENR